MTRGEEIRPLVIAALGLIALPFALQAIGLTLTSASDCVIYALVGLGLNLLLGYTGLTSFGHAAWYGVGAYTAGIIQTRYLQGHFLLPLLAAILLIAAVSFLLGMLILRRRGVYFSLLTLALSALTFTVSIRWTALTGGDNGLGGIERGALLGVNLDNQWNFYILVALLAFGVTWLMWRVVRSPFGQVLVAIRENEQRTAFLGYDVKRYKLAAFVISATVTGFAGALSAFLHRIAAADFTSVAFSGELIAMVVIGGMRSYLGPVLGALFYLLFRELLSQYFQNWLLFFGLLFVIFILFSPTGLVGVANRLWRMFVPAPTEAAAMAARETPVQTLPVPDFITRAAIGDGAVLTIAHASRTFGGITAVDDVSLDVKGRGVHALIGPNGAGKTTLFNLVSGLHQADRGEIAYRGTRTETLPPHRVAQAGVTRSFQITNLFRGLSVRENIRLAVQARDPHRFDPLKRAVTLAETNTRTDELIAFLGLKGLENVTAENLSYGGQRLLDLGIALAAQPGLVLLDEPLAGLSAAERDRVGRLVRRVGDTIGVLIVEHDIDRVFELAERVTVMNQGRVLLDGPTELARTDSRVHEVYIGSGTAAIAANPPKGAAVGEVLVTVSGFNGYYGKSHILRDVSLDVREREVVAVLGRNGAGKSTLLKGLIGIVRPNPGAITLDGASISGLAPEQIARLGVAYVPQGRRLYPGLSVRDNLMLGRLRRPGPSQWSDEKIFELFPRIRERYDLAADLLSGGEQQMVAIARALAGHVRVLLLDEPFEGLSPVMTEEVFKAVDRLRHEIAVVIVDHNLDLVLALADRAVVLDRGAVVHTGPARPLLIDLDLRRKVLWV
jgi:ABC-type branched-subunit amino acid transport system ATPase component/ABC-type branched-subunit amino acid transport system permease subunit